MLNENLHHALPHVQDPPGPQWDENVYDSMDLRSSATLNGASVFDLISSTVTPSANSIKVKP
jgi:hypothetical protein